MTEETNSAKVMGYGGVSHWSNLVCTCGRSGDEFVFRVDETKAAAVELTQGLCDDSFDVWIYFDVGVQGLEWSSLSAGQVLPCPVVDKNCRAMSTYRVLGEEVPRQVDLTVVKVVEVGIEAQIVVDISEMGREMSMEIYGLFLLKDEIERSDT